MLVVLWAVSSANPAFAGGEPAARRHAARANRLAAHNKCRSALPEFNRAYSVLKDPTLLFNRAECERKLGMIDNALNDYEKFLIAMPAAPNRASVESRITALRAMKDDRAGKASAPDSPPPAKPSMGAVKSGPSVAPSTAGSSKDGGSKADDSQSPRAEKWTE